MKKSLIVVFLLFGLFCSSQEVIIKQDRKSDLFKGVGFPFSLIGKNCESYIITTDNGKIEQYNSDCTFVVYPENIGIAKIKVKDKTGKILLEEPYKVREIEFKLSIIGANKNVIDIEYFLNFSRLDLVSPDFSGQFSWKCQFELIHISENKIITHSYISEHGSIKTLKEKIKSLNRGDILVFHKMKLLIGEYQFDTSSIVLTAE
jgi:hypothetical protein